MILLLHIIIALSSVAYTTYVIVTPNQRRVRTAYGTVALTLLSGAWLVVVHPAQMGRACMSGLVYIVCMSFLLGAVHIKLLNQKQNRSL
jgi:hypothetical protein